jgi:hypothetical protein
MDNVQNWHLHSNKMNICLICYFLTLSQDTFHYWHYDSPLTLCLPRMCSYNLRAIQEFGLTLVKQSCFDLYEVLLFHKLTPTHTHKFKQIALCPHTLNLGSEDAGCYGQTVTGFFRNRKFEIINAKILDQNLLAVIPCDHIHSYKGFRWNSCLCLQGKIIEVLVTDSWRLVMTIFDCKLLQFWKSLQEKLTYWIHIMQWRDRIYKYVGGIFINFVNTRDSGLHPRIYVLSLSHFILISV